MRGPQNPAPAQGNIAFPRDMSRGKTDLAGCQCGGSAGGAFVLQVNWGLLTPFPPSGIAFKVTETLGKCKSFFGKNGRKNLVNPILNVGFARNLPVRRARAGECFPGESGCFPVLSDPCPKSGKGFAFSICCDILGQFWMLLCFRRSRTQRKSPEAFRKKRRGGE